MKKIEDEQNAREEKERLLKEEKDMIPFNQKFEQKLLERQKIISEKEEWDKYSNCEDNFISVRKEKDLTAFIYEFKERSDTTFISNFVLKEKNIAEEVNNFDISENHCYNLYRLYLESKALYDNNMKDYALYYLSYIRELEKIKMESISKYFVEVILILFKEFRVRKEENGRRIFKKRYLILLLHYREGPKGRTGQECRVHFKKGLHSLLSVDKYFRWKIP